MDTNDIYITSKVEHTILSQQQFDTKKEGIFNSLSRFSYESGIELEEHIFVKLLDKSKEEKEDWNRIEMKIAVHTTISYGDYYYQQHDFGKLKLVFNYALVPSDPGPYLRKLTHIRYDFHNDLMEELHRLLDSRAE